MLVLSPGATWCLLIRTLGVMRQDCEAGAGGIRGWCGVDAALLPGVGKKGMMDTADRPVRKFREKGEEAPSSGH